MGDSPNMPRIRRDTDGLEILWPEGNSSRHNDLMLLVFCKTSLHKAPFGAVQQHSHPVT